MIHGIKKYIGHWHDPDGFCLDIREVDESHAIVSFFSPFGPPVSRPYWGGRDAIDMPAEYDEYNGDFQVELWEPCRGFVLDLRYDHSRQYGDAGAEILLPALSRFAEDDQLDAHYSLFGRLQPFRKIGAEQG